MARKTFELSHDIELFPGSLSKRSWRVVINALCKAADCEENEEAAAEYAALATDLDRYIAPFQ